MIDLHIHTTHSSDGQYRPDEIFEMALEKGLEALAFADHMDICAAGRGMTLAVDYGVEFYTGLEVSSALDGKEYHLLLYGFDSDSLSVRDFLTRHCSLIWGQVCRLIEYFQGMGFDITKADITRWGKSVPTGVTFLDALKKRNSTDPRLFDYLYGDKSCSPYLNFYKGFSLGDFGEIMTCVLPSIQQAISSLKHAGVLILAHPGDIDLSRLKELKDMGIDGIEVYSTHHTPETMHRLLGTARSLDLFVSAGSDFHGERIKSDIAFGDIPGQPDHVLIERLRGSGGVVLKRNLDKWTSPRHPS
ncbi:MAG TPA: PHP domain-containing protein [Deltaproteobacteria bacterium]|nr:PHP domain-containing protein [Deltaproteobacteria bacterium]